MRAVCDAPCVVKVMSACSQMKTVRSAGKQCVNYAELQREEVDEC